MSDIEARTEQTDERILLALFLRILNDRGEYVSFGADHLTIDGRYKLTSAEADALLPFAIRAHVARRASRTMPTRHSYDAGYLRGWSRALADAGYYKDEGE